MFDATEIPAELSDNFSQDRLPVVRMEVETLNWRRLGADGALLAVTFIWGSTFVIMKRSLAGMTPYWLLAIRFAIASSFLALVYLRNMRRASRQLWLAGLVSGLFLFGAYAFQTVGLLYTTAAKSGFITGLSLVLVPIIAALFLRKPPGLFAALGAVAAFVGLYFLTGAGAMSFNYGDVLTLFCAVSNALYVTSVGQYSRKNDPAAMTVVQLMTVCLASLAAALLFEPAPNLASRVAWNGILLTAIPATSLAFLVQNAAQRHTTTTHAAIVLSGEPVFAALFAYWLEGEVLGTIGMIGAGMMLAGMLLAELGPERGRGESTAVTAHDNG